MEHKPEHTITFDEMVAYVEGTMSSAEKQRIEEAIRQNPALGIDLNELKLVLGRPQGKTKLKAHVTHVDKGLASLTKSPGFSIRPVYWALAAGLLLLVSIGIWGLPTKEAAFQADSLMAWNEVPASRSSSNNMHNRLQIAFIHGTEAEWEKAASIFGEYEGQFYQNYPVNFFKARALFLSGRKTEAIDIFSKEIANIQLLENTRDDIRLYRLAAYTSLAQCEKAKVDLAFLEQKNTARIGETLTEIKKSLSKKCK
ncbi:MAG: hypothetical protein AB8F95_03625 [Bacteroidia bacterium]